MTLLRRSVRPVALLKRQCARSLSCTTRQQEDSPRNNSAAAAVLDVLNASNYSKPAKTPEYVPKPRGTSALVSNMTTSLSPKNVQDAEMSQKRADFEQQLARKFRPGDVYSPHDLSGQEQAKWKRSRNAPKTDAVDALGINPINEYKNFSMMSEYMTEMGRIKHSKDTGLRPVNQRKMAKAIRRAIGIGLMPSVHRHPQILLKDKRF